MKVLGCKVEDDLYNKIKKEHGNTSAFLRNLIDLYYKDQASTTKTEVNLTETLVNHISKEDEYKLLCKVLDSLRLRHNRFCGGD